VVALDGSPAAATALPLAQAVARRLGTRVESLCVAASADAQRAMQEALSCHLPAGAVLHPRWAVGDPVLEILRATSDATVEMLVLATHGRAIQSNGHLGRVAEAVIARTTHQILLVRPAAAARTGTRPGELRRWLLPLDGTPTTAAALQPATALAARLGAAIDVLYVIDPDRPPPPERGSVGLSRYADQAQHEWPFWTREISDRLCNCLARCPAEVPVRVYLAHGKTGPAIVEFAAQHQTDVIALVRRSRLEPGRAATLRAVLDSTPCPILLCCAQ